MKKKFLSLYFVLFLFCRINAQEAIPEVPGLLSGIWQGSDRLLMFSSDGNEFSLVLRVFYQWYNDRTAEPSAYNELKARDRNDAVSANAEDIKVFYRVITENQSGTAGVYELVMNYPHVKEAVSIPVCVVDGKLYLDFLIRTETENDREKSYSAVMQEGSSEREEAESVFYRAASSAKSISIETPVFSKEVLSYYLHEGAIYKIRYWLSGMEYSDAKASFSDGKQVFSVDKFLKIGDQLFQCTTGRSSKIRNIEKSSSFEKEITQDSDRKFIVFGKPYLVKVPEMNTKQDLLANVEENNRRRKPAPKPIFPPAEIDFHWKEISELEKYNPYTWNRRNIDIHK